MKDLRRLFGQNQNNSSTAAAAAAANDSQLLSRVLLLDNYPDVFVQPSNGLSISSFLPIESCEKCDCRNRKNNSSSHHHHHHNTTTNSTHQQSSNNKNNNNHHVCAAVTDTALLDLLPILEAISHLGDVRGVLQHRKNFST